MNNQSYQKAVCERFREHVVIQQAFFASLGDTLDGLDLDLAVEKAAHQYGIEPPALYRMVSNAMETLYRKMDEPFCEDN